MGDALDVTAEQSQAARLTAAARQASSGAVSGTLAVAAARAIASVQGDGGGGAIGEPVADLRRLRTDTAVMRALADDRRVAVSQALLLIADARWMGYRIGLESRSRGLPVTTSATAEDRAALAGYPIQGFTSAEIAADLGNALDRGVTQALSAPLTGTFSVATVPAALQAVSLAHAERVALAVDEAHAAGIGAAVREIGRALTAGRGAA